MEQLKSIRQCLVSQVQTQLGDLKKTNAKELGEVIDMIKDLEEAMYYCAITQAMEEKKDESKQTQNINYYMENPDQVKRYTPYMEYAPYMMRDDKWRDDRTSNSRKMYIEGKHSHQNDVQSMKDLEVYIKDLSDDMLDMVKESTPEEKQVLSSKLQMLASKVNK